jgi:hypothetical protein
MQEGRKILAVVRDEPFGEDMMNYSIHLTKRLSYDLIALSVRTSPDYKTDQTGEVFKRRAAENGIRCEYVIRIGDMAEAVESFHHETRRVEFVIAGSEAHKEEMTGIVTIPVFNIVSTQLSDGRKIMAEAQDSKTKLAVRTIGYGLLSAAMYAAVFMNAKTIMHYFTMGSWYAALPIATVFAFSLAHGAFASNLWSLMGINAAKKDDVHQTVRTTVRPAKRPRTRPRVRAYVNPFHRI